MPSYVVGVDFGTESGRAVVIDTADGRELGSAVYRYANGVIDAQLPAPDGDVRLEPDWALQDPEDYIRTFQQAVPAALADAGVDPANVVGIGTDFTACTMLPTKADGRPLCTLPELRREPHAWVKLWKHHAAQPEADRINAVARERGEAWLPRYGGKISSEWFYSKALQILDESPSTYEAADRFIEAADWVIWRLTGVESRNSCTAGYKAIWSKQEGFPDAAYFAALHPRMANIVDEKMSRTIWSIGDRAGELTEEAAGWTGLRPGTAVAVANVDAHVSVPAATVTEPGTHGHGHGHLHLPHGHGREDGRGGGHVRRRRGRHPAGPLRLRGRPVRRGRHLRLVRGQPGAAGLSRAGRHATGVDVHTVLEREAARLRPGQSGLRGARLVERQPLHPRRRGPLRPAHRGHPGHDGAGDLPRPHRGHGLRHAHDHRVLRGLRRAGQRPRGLRRPAGAQPAAHADLRRRHEAPHLAWPSHRRRRPSARPCGRPSRPARRPAATTRIEDAAARMARLRDERYEPDPAATAVYDELYAEYRTLHDYFGRGANDVMKRLRALRARTLSSAG